jgi:hypothetical protein
VAASAVREGPYLRIDLLYLFDEGLHKLHGGDFTIADHGSELHRRITQQRLLGYIHLHGVGWIRMCESKTRKERRACYLVQTVCE